MNWKDYSKLTNKQREEWNFRFAHDIRILDIKSPSTLIFNLFMLVLFLVMSVYVLEHSDSYTVELKDKIMNALNSLSSLLINSLWIILIFLSFDLFLAIYSLVKERLWFKKCILINNKKMER